MSPTRTSKIVTVPQPRIELLLLPRYSQDWAEEGDPNIDDGGLFCILRGVGQGPKHSVKKGQGYQAGQDEGGHTTPECVMFASVGSKETGW